MRDRASRVARESHARGRKIVEAVRVADILHSGRIANTPPHTFAVREIAEASRQGDRVFRNSAVGHRKVGAPPDDVGDRRAALDGLTRDDAVAVAQRIPLPELDRIDVERGGELIHLRLVRETRLDRAKPTHRAGRGVVRVRADGVYSRVGHAIGSGAEARRIRDDRGA